MKKTIFLSLIVILISVLYYNEVDNTITEEDKQYIPLYLKNVHKITTMSYEEEINFIRKVQNSVLSVARHEGALPFGKKRELKELYETKAGMCFDRSRVIEKILRNFNFKTRHIAAYTTKGTNSALKSLLTPGIPSHALTEVLTSKGWIVVDSNTPWISLTYDNNPISMQEIKNANDSKLRINWKTKVPSEFFNDPFTFVYGLYSRHGKFYPPFNFIPDINYNEFKFNFL